MTEHPPNRPGPAAAGGGAAGQPPVRLSTGRQVTLALLWFGISFLWGSFLAVVLPFLLLPEHPSPADPGLVAAGEKNTALAVLEGIGLVLAIVVQPAAGAISDGVRTRWGRRRPMIAVGAAGGVISLLLIGAAPSFWWLVGFYCLLQLSMNVAQGGYQGLLPDRVGSAQRGEASGFLGVATLSGQVAGIVVAGLLPPRVVILPIAAVVGATALATVLGVAEAPAPAPPAGLRSRPRRSPGAAMRGLRAYLAELRAYPDFCWVVASRFFAYTGLASIQRFAANYLRDGYSEYRVFGVDLGGAQSATAVLFALVIVFGLIATYPSVRLSDRVGRRRVLVAAMVLGAAGSALFLVAGSLTAVLLDAIPVGIAFGMLVSVDWAYMADLAPRRRSGKFLGFSNVATAGSQAAAPFALGPIIDAVNSRTGTGGYRVLFVASSLFFVLGAVVLVRVRRHRLDEEREGAAARPAPATTA